MTDEIDALRRKITKLEREIAVQKAGAESDPRRRALLDAGVPIDRLSDAAAVFKPSGNAVKNEWRIEGLAGDINSIARAWLSERPWFGGEPEVKAAPNETRPHIEGDRMQFPDGSSLPVDMLSADDLLSAAGATPTVATPEAKPDEAYINEGESDVDRDWRLAGAAPKAAS